MIFFILILAIIIFIGFHPAKKGEFHKNYCSIQNTGTINAVFSVLIFLSHATSYAEFSSVFDAPYFALRGFMGQLVVVTYLFFSGYGIMESVKKKGLGYVKAMPVNRLFKFWYHFAIVIIIYSVVLFAVSGRVFTASRYALSLIGLKSVGNSSWYIFVTLVLYVVVIASFLIFRKSNKKALICTCVLCVAVVAAEKYAGLPTRYYNTLLCFPLGMMFSHFKEKIEGIVMKSDKAWFVSLAASLVAFAGFVFLKKASGIFYMGFTFSFVIMIVLLAMKLQTKNIILDWFSRHIFSFFILQRIPMYILEQYGFAKYNYAFIAVSFLCTVILSVAFDWLMLRLDGIIFKNR